MLMREFYTVDRSPQEVRNLWEWAKAECEGRLAHEFPYAMGILAALEYLMGEAEELPQAYKGDFSLNNVLRQSEKPENVRSVGNTRVDEPLHDGLDTLRPGNPKTLLYKAPLIGGDIAGSQRGVDD